MNPYKEEMYMLLLKENSQEITMKVTEMYSMMQGFDNWVITNLFYQHSSATCRRPYGKIQTETA